MHWLVAKFLAERRSNRNLAFLARTSVGDVLAYKLAKITKGFIVDSMTFKYRRKITITEQSGSDLTDYQVLIELNSTNFDFSHAQTNGEDTRFTDASGNLLDYWIESWDAVNERAKVWVKVPSIPANSSVEIWMYYGNPTAKSASDGDGVFEFFDDFRGIITDLTHGFYSSNDAHPKPICPYGARPCAIRYVGNHDRTYFVIQFQDGDYGVAYYDHNTGETSEFTIIPGLLPDDLDHNNPGIFVSSDGYIFILGGIHGDSAVPVKKSLSPEDISSFGDWQYVGSASATYPSMIEVDGTLFIFYRNSESETRFIKSTDGGETWTDDTLIAQMGPNTWEHKNYYIMTGVHVAPDGSIHVAVVKRETGLGTWGSWKRLFYMKSDDLGVTWKKADGTVISLPGDETTMDDIDPDHNGQIGADMCFDANNNPVILYSLESSSDPNKRDWKIAKWNGSAWEIRTIVTGVNRYIWNHGQIRRTGADTYEAYLVMSSEVEGGDFWIEKWVSNDGGVTWSKEADIAKETENDFAVPYIVRNHHPDFLLIYGEGPTAGSCTVVGYPNINLEPKDKPQPDNNKWQKILSGVSIINKKLSLKHSDDYHGGDIFSIKTFSLPFILEYKWKAGMADVEEYVGMQSTTDPSNWVTTAGVDWIIGFRNYRQGSAWYFNTVLDGNNTQTSEGTTDSNWHRIKIVATPSSVKFYADDTLVQEHTTNIPDSPLYICADHILYSGTDVETLVDFIFVRKYTEPEPSVSLGEEETA